MSHSLLEPDQAFDDAWTDRVRALPREQQASLLRHADELRRSTVGLAPVFACYRALGRSFDPTLQEDGDRLLWLLRRARVPEPEIAYLAQLVADGESGSPLWAQAKLCLAVFERATGGLPEALRRLSNLYREVEGWGGLTEGLVATNLGLCLVQAGRDIEALILLRRAVALLEVAGEARPLYMTRMQLAIVYAQLGDWTRYDRLAAEVEREFLALPEDDRESLRIQHLMSLAGVAMDRGDHARSLRLLEAIEFDDPSVAWWTRSLRSLVLAQEGRQQEARTELQALQDDRALSLYCVAAQALCAVALDPAERGRSEVERTLTLLEDPDFESQGNRAAMLLLIAEHAEGDPAYEALAKRAYDGAATALLGRIFEADRFCRRQPGLATLRRQERRILGEVHKRLTTRTRRVRRAVAAMLRTQLDRSDTAPFDGVAEADVLHLCAWCGRLRGPADAWMLVGAYIPDDPLVATSHGICPDCLGDEIQNA